ncbi:MAG TPA: IclR family transcriptional regulator [Actinobacteria bacterium]|nr:IclR family transcriptional regulator [Actinomycetota bacterium]
MADQLLTSVRNALRVLKAFRHAERELGVSELARELGLGKSTVHRLAKTLAAEGFLRQDPATGRYRPGLVLAELGAAVTLNTDFHAAAIGPLEELWKLTGETVQIAHLDGREVVYVERIESSHTLRLFNEVGRRNWAHCTGTGKALLAHLPPDELDAILDGWELPALTPYTIVDHDRLRADLAEVRERGYAQNVNESNIGIASVGAPIRDFDGSVIAAISAAGPTLRLKRTSLEGHAGAVMAAAEAISRNLGWRPARLVGGRTR